MALGWGATASVAGGAMALMGALWRQARGRDAALLGSVPAAALAGEAVLLTATWGYPALVLAAELLLAVLVLGVLTWRRAPFHAALLAASVFAVVFAGVEAQLRDMMRAAGWQGA